MDKNLYTTITVALTILIILAGSYALQQLVNSLFNINWKIEHIVTWVMMSIYWIFIRVVIHFTSFKAVKMPPYNDTRS